MLVMMAVAQTIQGALAPWEVLFPPSAYDSNRTLNLKDGGQQVASARLQWWTSGDGRRVLPKRSRFHVLPSLVARGDVADLREVLAGATFDTDADTVDGMATYEFVLEVNGSWHNAARVKYEAPHVATERAELRPYLSERMRPHMQRLTDVVRGLYKADCATCTPCHSIVRRYARGERRQHRLHVDQKAFVSAVVSLSDHGVEYAGGLRVASAGTPPRVLPLARGDAVVHRSDLLHDVLLPEDEGDRWSWITWFDDREQCDNDGQRWFGDCAEDGQPLCQYLLARSLSSRGEDSQALVWMRRAAEAGLGMAMNSHAVDLRSMGHLERAAGRTAQAARLDDAAERLFRGASDDADARCNLGQLLYERADKAPSSGGASGAAASGGAPREAQLVEAVAHFRAAASLGSSDCAYNLAVALLKGLGGETRNPYEALGWLRASSTVRSLRLAASIEEGRGRTTVAAELRARVARLEVRSPPAPPGRSSPDVKLMQATVNDGHFKYVIDKGQGAEQAQ